MPPQACPLTKESEMRPEVQRVSFKQIVRLEIVKRILCNNCKGLERKARAER